MDNYNSFQNGQLFKSLKSSGIPEADIERKWRDIQDFYLKTFLTKFSDSISEEDQQSVFANVEPQNPEDLKTCFRRLNEISAKYDPMITDSASQLAIAETIAKFASP